VIDEPTKTKRIYSAYGCGDGESVRMSYQRRSKVRAECRHEDTQGEKKERVKKGVSFDREKGRREGRWTIKLIWGKSQRPSFEGGKRIS